MPNRIFLSYRRDDSQSETDQLYRRLCAKFGEQHVFKDLDTIPKGRDFVRVIDENLRTCAAAVVVIGDRWLDIEDDAGNRRLDKPGDFVRLEIAAALARDIPVIPLLVRDASMPEEASLPDDLKPLVRRQIAVLRKSQLDTDAAHLARELEAALGFYHGALSRTIAQGLAALRERIARADIPTSVPGKTLNIATWNIRQLGHHKRRKASLHYIAEILSQFDLIGVSEAQGYRGDLRKIELMLGPFWQVLFSGGFSFIFDRRKIHFAGMARQVTGLPPHGAHRHEPIELPFWRNPYVVSFRSPACELVLVLAHVRWGRAPQERVTELEAFARWIDIFRKSKELAGQRLIAFGTFQTPSTDDPTFTALTDRGLVVPLALRAAPGSNYRKDKVFQQILSYEEDADVFTDCGGVLDFIEDDMPRGPMTEPLRSPLYARTKLIRRDYLVEMSDNLPLWVQLKID